MRDWTAADRALMDDMLDEYRQRWENDSEVAALGEAVAFSGWNEYPLPQWCVQPVLDALAMFNQTGTRGQGTPETRLSDLQKARERHGLVKVYLEIMRQPNGKKYTLTKACEAVSKKLTSHSVTPRAVLDSYRTIEKQTPK